MSSRYFYKLNLFVVRQNKSVRCRSIALETLASLDTTIQNLVGTSVRRRNEAAHPESIVVLVLYEDANGFLRRVASLIFLLFLISKIGLTNV